jgi:hypothetical protein
MRILILRFVHSHLPSRLWCPHAVAERTQQQMGPAAEFLHAIPYLWDREGDDPRVLDVSVHEAIRSVQSVLLNIFGEADPHRAYHLLKDQVWPVFEKILPVEAHAQSGQNWESRSQRMLKPTPANRLLQLMMKPDPNRTSAEEKVCLCTCCAFHFLVFS